MKKTMMIINLICLVGFAVSLIWAGFGIGKDEYGEVFQQRMLVVFAFQAPCLVFFAVRRLRRSNATPKETRDFSDDQGSITD